MALSPARIAANKRSLASAIGAGIITPGAGVTLPLGAVIAAVGPSTVAGTATGGGTGQVANSWPSKLAAALTAQGIKASAQNRFGCASGTWANLLAMDGRVSSTGTWSQTGSLVAGGNAFSGGADGDTATLSLGNCTKIIVQWVNSTAGRIFSYAIDGGAAVDVTTTGVYEPRQTEIAVSAGAQSLTLTRKTGAVNIRGVEAYDDTGGVPIRILNLGISGATTGQLIDNTDTTVGRRVHYGQLAPDVAFTEGGIINDWYSTAPITVATSKANLTTLVQTLKAAKGGACKVVLMTPVFDNRTSVGNTANQELYVQALREVAVEQAVPILDIRAIFRSFAYAQSQGWMSDDVHPNAAGYAVIAEAVRRFIRFG